jgi:hypothetical protein
MQVGSQEGCESQVAQNQPGLDDEISRRENFAARFWRRVAAPPR